MSDELEPLEEVKVPYKRPPGFLKGNNESAKKLGMKYAKTQQWDNFGAAFLSKFTEQYNLLMEQQAVGEPLNEAQEKFMDRYEKMSEYFKPKLQRVEGQHEHSFKHLEALQDQLKSISSINPPENAEGSNNGVSEIGPKLPPDDNQDAAPM